VRIGRVLIVSIAASWFQSAWSAEPASKPSEKTSHFDARYGCAYGYRQQGRMCVPVSVPAHAYLNSFGDYWNCGRGFRRTDDRCVPIVVPDNAHLTEATRVVRTSALPCACPRTAFSPHPVTTGDVIGGYASGCGSCVQLGLPPHDGSGNLCSRKLIICVES